MKKLAHLIPIVALAFCLGAGRKPTTTISADVAVEICDQTHTMSCVVTIKNHGEYQTDGLCISLIPFRKVGKDWVSLGNGTLATGSVGAGGTATHTFYFDAGDVELGEVIFCPARVSITNHPGTGTDYQWTTTMWDGEFICR